MLKEYRGFRFECESEKSELALMAYIDSLGDEPSELPNVSDENYANWQCDFDFDGVKILVLPESVKKIGKCVFAQSKIQNLVADGVEHIDELAFYNTKKLESVSAKNCKTLISIDPKTGEPAETADCFNHSHVKALHLPNVELVGRYCFYDMPNIETIDLPKAMVMLSHSVYGNKKLRMLRLPQLQEAPSSLVTMNPCLQEVDVSGLQVASPMAFYGNGIEIDFGLKHEVFHGEEKLTKLEQKQLQEKEVFEYDYSYKGFYFNLVDGLSEQEKIETLSTLEREIDFWVEQAEIPNSKNMHTNESGHASLINVKDIFVSEKIKAIGDYAFAKMYALESVVAPSVKTVGEHAFYCDSAVRYVDIDGCEKLSADAFNGTAYDYIEFETKPKIFVSKVKSVGKHVFWQTGFVFVNMPKCEEIEVSAFEENGALKKVVVKNAHADAFIENPMLSEVVEKGDMSKIKQ